LNRCSPTIVALHPHYIQKICETSSDHGSDAPPQLWSNEPKISTFFSGCYCKVLRSSQANIHVTTDSHQNSDPKRGLIGFTVLTEMVVLIHPIKINCLASCPWWSTASYFFLFQLIFLVEHVKQFRSTAVFFSLATLPWHRSNFPIIFRKLLGQYNMLLIKPSSPSIDGAQRLVSV
jgi:hypothetical protein